MAVIETWLGAQFNTRYKKYYKTPNGDYCRGPSKCTAQERKPLLQSLATTRASCVSVQRVAEGMGFHFYTLSVVLRYRLKGQRL
jgi:hypothetical protein